jgi:hypothetical protein
VAISKFKAGRKVEKMVLKGEGAIHNAILVPFSLRRVPVLEIGSTFEIRLPKKFVVKLISVEDVTVPAGTFKAYHFTSTPFKFEIWISQDKLRLPLKIKGAEGLGYTLSLIKRAGIQP